MSSHAIASERGGIVIHPLLGDNTTMIFIELPIFIRASETLFSDDDIRAMQNILLENPSAGDLIQGGRGLRKLRVPLTGRGKRGGARVIYYHWVNQSLCYLIYAYAKNVSADLTPDQLHKLATVMEKELNHG
jgi:hypothetical protein